MATDNVLEYLGRGATAQLVAEVKALLETKVNTATTLAGYGITDAYTKEEVVQKIEEYVNETILGGAW